MCFLLFVSLPESVQRETGDKPHKAMSRSQAVWKVPTEHQPEFMLDCGSLGLLLATKLRSCNSSASCFFMSFNIWRTKTKPAAHNHFKVYQTCQCMNVTMEPLKKQHPNEGPTVFEDDGFPCQLFCWYIHTLHKDQSSFLRPIFLTKFLRRSVTRTVEVPLRWPKIIVCYSLYNLTGRLFFCFFWFDFHFVSK